MERIIKWMNYINHKLSVRVLAVKKNAPYALME